MILFNALSDDDFVLILDLLIEKENKLARERGLTLSFTEAAKKWLLAQNDEPGVRRPSLAANSAAQPARTAGGFPAAF